MSGAELDDEAIKAFVGKAHEPLEALVHTFCDEAYEAIMTSAQNYLASNLTYNLASTLATAERERRSAWERADVLKRQNADLLEALEAIMGLETYDHHVGYDSGSGGGNYTYAEVVRTDNEAFAKARAAILKTKDTSHG